MVVSVSAEEFVGTYMLISNQRTIVDTGEVVDAYGPNPKGYIVYGIEGRMLTFVVHDVPRAPKGAMPTNREKAALYDSMIAYGGTYVYHGDRVEHHIDMAYNHAWAGTKNVRYIFWEDGRLVYRTPPAPFSADGRVSIFEVVWQKLPALAMSGRPQL